MPGSVPSLLALVSALAAVMHQVTWSRTIGLALGNTAWGVGLALGIFMAGVGIGTLSAPHLIRHWHRLHAYVVCEIVIGASSLASNWALLHGRLPSQYLGTASSDLGFVADLVGVVVMLAAPALAIGMTYPLLVAASQQASGESVASDLYVAQLVGAVLGAILAATVIAPQLGLLGLATIAAALNLLVAGIAAIPAVSGTLMQVRPAKGQTSPERGEGLSTGVGLFAVSGAVGLSLEVVWNRVLLPYAGVSILSFAGIVACYVGLQAVGMSWAARRGPNLVKYATWAAVSAAPLAIASLFWLSHEGSVAPGRMDAPLTFTARTLLAVVLPMSLPTLVLGIAQAGALRLASSTHSECALGVARAVGWGTLASAGVGACAQLVLLPALGPRLTIAAVGLLPVGYVGLRGQAITAGVAALAATASVLLAPGPANFLGPAFDELPVLFAEHGVQDTVGVVWVDQPGEPRIRRLVSSGVSYSGDSVFAQRYMRLLAHLPSLAARNNRRALLICVGTGSTGAALATYGYESITAVDISPSILRQLNYFVHVNQPVLTDPRVHFVVDDGYRFLRTRQGHYDVITLEPPPPRAPGASTLYSREFYGLAAGHLSRGGVVAQWLPLHGLNGVELAGLSRTFAASFRYAAIYLAERNEAILLGSDAPIALRQPARLARPSVRADLARIGGSSPDPLTDTLWSRLGATRIRQIRGPAVTVSWPYPEYVPLVGLGTPTTNDVFAEQVDAWGDSDRSPKTFASIVGPAVPSYLRVLGQRAQPHDGQRVVTAMQSLRGLRSHDPYVLSMFRTGPLLEERITRLRREGLSDEVADEVLHSLEARDRMLQ